MRAWLVLVAVAGCSEHTVDVFALRPVVIVWEHYAAKAEPPQVIALNGWCTENGIARRAFRCADACCAGLYEPDGAVTIQDQPTWHETALAHELMHAVQWLDLHVQDPGHTSGAWRPGGAVEQANAALIAAGY